MRQPETKQPRPRDPDRSSARAVRRRRVYRLIVAGVALAVGLVLGEIMVRVAGLAPEFKPIVLSEDSTVYKRSRNPILGFEMKVDYRDDHADLKKSYPRTNSHGQRDIERRVEKPEGVRRIILLGDSIVEGFGVRDLDDTISRHFERLDPEGRTEVLNFGVSAYCTLAEVELLRTKGLKFEPDVVILMFVGNDFDNFNQEAFQLGSSVNRPPVVESLFMHSHLMRLVFLQFNLFQFQADRDPVSWNKEAIGDNNVVEGLALLRELSAAHGFEVLVAIWPSFDDDGIVDVQEMPGDAQGELVIERLAAANGLPTLRLSKAFQQDADASAAPVNPRLRYTIGDKLHPSVEGCRIAAEALRSAVEEGMARRASREGAAPDRERDRAARDAARLLGRNSPDYAIVHTTTADELMGAGKVDEAIRQYRLALEEDPKLAEAHNNLGMALLSQGEVEEAIAHYRRAIEADPESAPAHNNLANVLRTTGQRAEAIDHYREALKIQPRITDAHFNLGNILASGGQFEDAIVHYRKALELQPDYAAVHTNLGNALQSKGQLDEAIGHYREALRLGPPTAKVHFGLGFALRTQGKRDEAIDHLRKALALEPGHEAARRALEATLQQPTSTGPAE